MGRRLQARRDDAEKRALLELTVSYLGVFAVVIGALSVVAYAFIDNTYRSIVAPALETPEGRAGFAAAMRPALFAILSVDAMLSIAVGAVSFALARAALRPLAAAREREERFSADVAHELRTPLAAIASLAQAGTGGDLPAAQNSLRAIARRALECGELVGDLLTLARASGSEALQCEPVDVAILAHRICAEAAVRPGVRIDCTGENAIVMGDERRLAQLVRNLVENAALHARSSVTWTAEVVHGMVRLVVRTTARAWRRRCGHDFSSASRRAATRAGPASVLRFAAGCPRSRRRHRIRRRIDLRRAASARGRRHERTLTGDGASSELFHESSAAW